MEFCKLIDQRRSTRTFNGQAMSSEMVQELLYAASKAPNACNYQSWHFYVLDQAGVEKLVPEVYRGEWIIGAGAAFVVCTEDGRLAERFGERGKMFAVQDTAAAMTMLLLRAADFGWAGCWLGAFDPDACRRMLEIPEERTPVAIAVVGCTDTMPPQRERKPMEEICTMIGDFKMSGCTETKSEPFALRTGYYGGAVFFDVNLMDAKFDDVSLHNARFNNINMSGTKFTDINLQESSFAGVTMAGTRFGAEDAEDICVSMEKAQFNYVNFTEAVLKHCKLCGIKLENCDLTGLTIDGMSAEEYFKKIIL